MPDLRRRVGAIVDLAADFRLKDASLYPTWYGDEHHHPELLAEFAFGLPELFRDRPRRCDARRGAGLLRHGRLAGAGAAGAARGSSSRPASSSTPRRACRAPGGRPKATTAFCTVDEDFTAYGLLDHRHTPEIEQATGAQVLFTPHLAPMNRGILATCYARPAGGHVAPTRCSPRSGGFYADEPFVVVGAGLAVDQGDARLEHRPPHRPLRPAHRLGGGASCALDNLVKGASGQALQCANLALGLPETTGLPARRAVPVSVTAPAGLRGRRGRRAASRPAGDPDLSLVATADGQPVAAAATFTPNKLTAAPVVVSRAPPGRHRRAGRGGDPQQRQRQRRQRRDRASSTPSGCAPRTAAALGCAARATCWSAPRASSASRFPIEVVEAGVPALVAARSPEGGADAARAIMTTDTVAKEVLVVRPGLHASAAWPRARRCWPRTWPRCWPCSRPTPRPSRPRSRRALRAGGRPQLQPPGRATAARRPTTP